MDENGVKEDALNGQESAPPKRRRLQRGCRLPFAIILLVIVVLVLANLVWLWMGTKQFESWAKGRIEQNLAWHLGRSVTIGRLSIERGRHFRVVLQDVRIGNAPGATRPVFAVVGKVELEGELESLRSRTFVVRSVRILNPRAHVEIFPEGSPLHDNVPRWRRSEPSKVQLVRTEISRVDVEDGLVELLDRKHDFQAIAHHAEAELIPGPGQKSWNGTGRSPDVAVHLRDYEPFSVRAYSRIHWEPGHLRFAPAHVDGKGVHARLSGTVTMGEHYGWHFDLGGSGELSLARRVFRIARPISGTVGVIGAIHGDSNGFEMTGSFESRAVHADVYDVENPKGTFRIDGNHASLALESGTFAGGPLTGSWSLPSYERPLRMSADLAFRDASLERVFEAWGMPHIGLKSLAAGTIDYAWEGDQLLEGHGHGEATLTPGAQLQSKAPFPIDARGATKFDLDAGTIRFARSTVETKQSRIGFSGTLAISSLAASLDYDARTEALSELDRLFVDLRTSLGSKDATLFGLGGSATLGGHIGNRLSKPDIKTHVDAKQMKYNDVGVGNATIDLAWAGENSRLSFASAEFRDGPASMSLRGTVDIPETTPPRFDLAFDARDWDVERAIATAKLDLAAKGRGTGRLTVQGSEATGVVRFDKLDIERQRSRLTLGGTVGWAPGKGNVNFNLDVAAEAMPIEDIATFLEFGSIPLTGPVTGTMHLDGPRAKLEGAGSITIRDGAIFGEPVDTATADLLFTSGTLKATHLEVHMPAGDLRGEGSYDLDRDVFSYVLQPTEIDLDKLKDNPLEKWVDGRVRLASSGAGSIHQPDLVIDASLVEGKIHGVTIEKGVPLPTLYVATRDGQLIIRGSALGHLAIQGNGTISPTGDLAGEIDLNVDDVAALMKILSPDEEPFMAGRLGVRLHLGGNIGSLETLDIRGDTPTLDLTVSGYRLTADQPIAFRLANGALHFDHARVRSHDSTFTIDGSVPLVGKDEMQLSLRGQIEAALLQLVIPDTRASGLLRIALDASGTLAEPRLDGTVEIQGGSVRFADFPQGFDDIVATLVFRGGGVSIDSFNAKFGGGTVTAGGTLALDGTTLQRARVTIQGKNVSLRYYEGLTVDSNFDVVLSGDVERLLLQGNLDVSRAVYAKDFDFASSLLNLLLERKELTTEAVGTWQNKVALRLHMKANDTLAVRNNVAEVSGSADLDVTGTLAAPIILGRITMDEGGRLRFQDIDYRVVQGTINFQNPFRNDPYLDITAEGRVTQATPDSSGVAQDYDLTVNLTGTLDRIQPTITSDPPLGQLTLLTLLSGNVGVDQARSQPGSVSLTGASFLMSTIGEKLGQKILPFADSIRFEPGLTGDTTSFSPTVMFEKRISDEIQVIVVYETASALNKEIIQWQFSPDWIIQFTRDSQQPGTYLVNAIDARFRRRYKGH